MLNRLHEITKACLCIPMIIGVFGISALHNIRRGLFFWNPKDGCKNCGGNMKQNKFAWMYEDRECFYCEACGWCIEYDEFGGKHET